MAEDKTAALIERQQWLEPVGDQVQQAVAVLTVIVGAVAVVGLPVAQFPQIAPPEVQVSAI